MGYNHQDSLENTVNTMGTLLGVHPIVHWFMFLYQWWTVYDERLCRCLEMEKDLQTIHVWDADLARFSICWVKSHETRRNQCFKIDLPIVNQLNLHWKHSRNMCNNKKLQKTHLSNYQTYPSSTDFVDPSEESSRNTPPLFTFKNDMPKGQSLSHPCLAVSKRCWPATEAWPINS